MFRRTLFLVGLGRLWKLGLVGSVLWRLGGTYVPRDIIEKRSEFVKHPITFCKNTTIGEWNPGS